MHLFNANSAVSVALMVLSLLISCRPDSPKAVSAGPDIAAWLDREIQQLYHDSAALARTTIINERRQQQLHRWVDWKKEFALFYRSDISSPALAARYQSDTIRTDTLLTVTFTATDPSLRTQKISLSFRDKKLVQLQVTNQSNGLLSSIEEQLILFPGEGYSIRSRTRNRFFGDQFMHIVGIYQYDVQNR